MFKVVATVFLLSLPQWIRAALPTEFLSNFQIPAHNYAPEGVFWDATSQQFLFGSVSYGGIYSVKPGFSDLQHQVTKVYNPNNLGYGSVGLYVDTGSNRYNLWAALANFTFTAAHADVDGGLMYVNMLTGKTVSADFAQYNLGNGVFVNDVVTDDAGNAFATNSFDGQIFKATYNAATGTIDSSVFFYNANYKFSGFGFNGIEYYNGALLVGITQAAGSGGGILWINATDPTQYKMVQVTAGVIDSIDGMRFNSDKSMMYMVRSPDKLISAVSTDNWASAAVIQNFTIPANCQAFLSTIAYIPSINHEYVMCTSSFSAGPYNIAQFN